MKKSKRSVLLGLLTLCAVVSLADEYGYFCRPFDSETWVPQSITLNSGDQLIVLSSNGSLSSTSYSGFSCTNRIGGMVHMNLYRLGLSTDSGFAKALVGPLIVFPETHRDAGTYIAYKIIRTSDNSIKPTNVIVLPADPGGDMQLVFESSDDLLSWNQEFSFTHNSTNQSSNFFRTRLIQGNP